MINATAVANAALGDGAAGNREIAARNGIWGTTDGRCKSRGRDSGGFMVVTGLLLNGQPAR